MAIIPRHIEPRLQTVWQAFPAVFLEGPRQAGKTTLVTKLARERGATYVTLDDLDTLAAARSDPEGFLAGLGRPLVLDEVQRAPELLLALKASIDRARLPGSFLLTGSANVLALPRVTDALVGRLSVLTLYPFSQAEIERTRPAFLEKVFTGPPPPDWDPLPDWRQRLTRGGYPPAIALGPELRREWFRGYLRTLLERDLRDLAAVQQVDRLYDLLRLLAERSASLANLAEMSRTLGMPRSTTEKYLRLLEKLFLLVRLPAWAKNPTKRLTKAPKLHFVDTGLCAFLMHEPRDGALFENFVAMEVAKLAASSGEDFALYHFRDAAGHEVDLVLEGPRGVVGLEVKVSARLTPADFRGLKALKALVGDRWAGGYVIHPGARALPFGEGLWSLPLTALWAW